MIASRTWKTGVLRSLALVALLVASPAVADDVIYSGVDLWRTTGGGMTYSSFASDPIPADFFCPGSKPFAGRIAMKGSPLASEPPGGLGNIDTIVHRLDNATFDDEGRAITRIRLLALSLVSIEPVDTGCGLYDVAVSLDGEQPITQMQIIRETPDGGSYVAPLALDLKVVFTPVERTGEQSVFHQSISLSPGTNSIWSSTKMIGTFDGKPARVDTDGDGMPDTDLPRMSNFRPGVAPASTVVGESVSVGETGIGISQDPIPGTIACMTGTCPYTTCHCTPWDQDPDPYEPSDGCDHLHCVDICVPCYMEIVESTPSSTL